MVNQGTAAGDGVKIRSFYAAHGPITDPGQFAHLLAGFPRSGAALCRAIQGLMVHIFWARAYGLELDEARKGEVNLRWVPRQIARALELDPAELHAARPLPRKLVGNCRDFSVLFCAALRQKGIPARARCGFGTYFRKGSYEDHWVAEYWDEDAGRWIMVDPQLDDFQVDKLGIDFNPLDMPAGRFITGGEAWRMCREGEADPERFGIFDMHGLWFVQGDLIRDFLALNKIEILPWDPWGMMAEPQTPLTPDDALLLDRIALVSREVDTHWDELRRLFQGEPRLGDMPRWWAAER